MHLNEFLLLLISCMNIPWSFLFIHLPVDGHLGYFQWMASLSKAALTVLV